jgi:hypothetical protein
VYDILGKTGFGGILDTCFKSNDTDHISAYCELHVGSQVCNGFLRNKMAEFKYVLESVVITLDTAVEIVIEVIRIGKCTEELKKNDENHPADNNGEKICAVASV